MEQLDLYDCYHRPTGQTMVRGEMPPEGLYGQVIHVCIFNSKGQMLIQQRQPWKNWGDMWDVSVGGSVLTGETSQQGAQREILEELGLEVDLSNLAPALTTTFSQGFDDFFVLRMDLDPRQLHLQESEVKDVQWACMAEVMELLEKGAFIPYHKGFMEYLFFRADHDGDFDIKE